MPDQPDHVRDSSGITHDIVPAAIPPADPGERPAFRPVTLGDYEHLVGSATIERLAKKAERLRDIHVANVSSTYYGGGVAEILSSLTLLMNASGIRTGWRVIQGRFRSPRLSPSRSGSCPSVTRRLSRT
jgi:hypothetical protein